MEKLLYNFTAFFVILDPVGTAAVFALMTRGIEPPHRRHMAMRATWLAGAILLAFAAVGEPLFRAMGISMPAFKIAGGMLLFLLSVDMVFARQSGLRSVTTSEDREAVARDDITVFPLAFPLIAGPGAMTSVVLLMGEAANRPSDIAIVLGPLAVVLLILLVMLLLSARVLKLLGVTGANVISRVLGIILAALAAEYVVRGAQEAFTRA